MVAAAQAEALEFLEEFEEIDRTLFLCGFANPIHHFCLIDGEGLDTLDSFGDIPDETFDRTVCMWESKGERIAFGIGRLQKMKAVAFWVRKCQREGTPINVVDLDDTLIARMRKEKSMTEKEEKLDAKLYYPPPFDPMKYVQWECSFENYLDSQRGHSKIPLSYMIRPADADPEEAETEYERVIWSAPHEGLAFEEDNREVYRIYKDLMNGMDGWAWFNQAQVGNGCQAHQLIVEYYRGTAEVARRTAEAEAAIDALFYQNKQVLKFESYLSRLSENFDLLEDNNGQGLSKTQKVKKFLEGIISTHQDVINIKGQIRDRFSTKFYEAVKHFATQLSMIPGYMANRKDQNRAKRRVMAMIAEMERDHNERVAQGYGYSQNYRYGGHGCGRGHIGNHNRQQRQYRAGVDVTDPTRTFTRDEYARLRASGHLEWLANMHWNNRGRPRNDVHGGRGGHGRGRGHGGRGHGRQVAFLEQQQDADQGNMENMPNVATAGNQRGGNAGAHFGGCR
jgi:hypothetical protein